MREIRKNSTVYRELLISDSVQIMNSDHMGMHDTCNVSKLWFSYMHT